jgi:putative hydrolase of the HAD superfamily
MPMGVGHDGARPEYRAVFFDWGGVVMDMGWAQMAELERRYGLPERTMARAIYGTPEWQELQVGRGSRAAYLAAIARELERAAGRPVPECLAEWRALVRGLNTDVVELARALRPRYTVGLLSNADDRLETILTERYGLGGLFEPLIISAHVGLAKPDPAIYRLAAARAGLPPEQCIFIDDTARNAEAATRTGMHGIHFTGFDALAAELRACGLTW